MADMRWPMKWNARWIWVDPPAQVASPIAAAAIPPRETWNRFCYLRRAFDLASVPASVPARVTADSRFILYVNGVEAARGPARSVPECLAWCEVDLAPMMKPGRNVVAALVRFYGSPMPWWRPAAANLQLGFGSFAFEAPSIGIISDDSWKSRPAPYQQEVRAPAMLPVPPMEIFDGREEPLGWTLAGYDDSSWKPAAVLSAGTLAANRTLIPVEPYTSPEPDEIAPLTSIPLTLREKRRCTTAPVSADDPIAAYPAHPSDTGDLMITFEAGETLATPWIEVCGPRGAIVDVYAGEDVRDSGTAEIRPRDYASRYIVRGNGVERFEGYEAAGFRYLTVIARGGAEVLRSGATERRYPRAKGAFFSCDDERLNAIWNTGARTLDLCSTDAFVDCPGREQRAWLGDSYIHSLVSFVANSDWRLARRHLRICAHSRRPDGLLAMCAAGDFSLSSTTIPDYSLHWVRALARYFDYSGDAETVRELAPAAVEVLAAFERYRAADGLIRAMPGWIFIDWAMTQRSEVVGALDALYAAALDDFAVLSENALGDGRTGAVMRERAARTRAAFELLWDESCGAYVDAADARGALRRVSQQTNAAAIVGGCAPRKRWNRMLDYILDPERLVITPTISDNRMAYIAQRMDPAEHVRFNQESDVVAAQPFFCHFVHDAIARAGRRHLIAANCLSGGRRSSAATPRSKNTGADPRERRADATRGRQLPPTI